MPEASAVTVSKLPDDERARRRVENSFASRLGIPLGETRQLLAQLPATLPRRFRPDEVTPLIDELSELGATLSTHELDEGTWESSCGEHPMLIANELCSTCGASGCPLCVTLEPKSKGARSCPTCRDKASRKKRFFHIRVSILLTLLLITLLYAFADIRDRDKRHTYEQPVHVALIWLIPDEVSPELLDGLNGRAEALADRLAQEMARYRPDLGAPFQFSTFGPVAIGKDPPIPEGEELMQLATYNYDLWRYTSRIDDAADLDADKFDARIYVVVRESTGATVAVEGLSQQGGRIGTAQIAIRDGHYDFAMFVIAHELFHVLGASDKYDMGTGAPLVPLGFADPNQSPLYPQTHVEIMARSRMVTPTDERLPDRLEELRVNEITAQEIGWVK